MPSLSTLRTELGDYAKDKSDEDLLGALSKATGEPLAKVADRYNFAPGSGSLTGERFAGSWSSYKSNLQDTGRAVASGLGLDSLAESLDRARSDNKVRSDVANQRAAALGGIQRWSDDEATGEKGVHGVGDFFNYLGGLGAQSAPYLAEAYVGGALGRAGAAAIGGARGLVLAGRALGLGKAARAENIGALAGSVAASYPSSVGDILSNQREQAPDAPTNDVSAAIGGVPYSLLNAFEPSHLAAARMRGFRGPEMLDKLTGIKGGLARAGARATITGLEEGTNETGQEVLNQYFGRMAVDPKATLTDPGALDRYKESFIGGGVLGGTTSAALGGWRRSGSGLVAPPPAPADTSTTQDLLRLGYDPTVGNARNTVVNPNPMLVTPEGQAIPGAAEQQAHDYWQAGQRAPGGLTPPAAESNWGAWVTNHGLAPWGAPAVPTDAAGNPLPTSYQAGSIPPNFTALVGQQVNPGISDDSSVPPDWQLTRPQPGGAQRFSQHRDANGNVIDLSPAFPYDPAATQQPGTMVGNSYGHVSGTGQQRADMLAGPATSIGPGTELARARVDQLAAQARAEAAEREAYAKKQADAQAALAPAGPDGQVPVKIKAQEVRSHAMLTELLAKGKITEQKRAELLVAMQEALQTGDTKELGRVHRELLKLTEEAKAPAPAPAAPAPSTPPKAPNVSKPAPAPTVPAGSAPAGAPVAARSQPAAGPNAVQSEPVGAVSTGVPTDSGAPAPVAAGPAAGGTPAVATPAPAAPAPAGQAAGEKLKKAGALVNRVKEALAAGAPVVIGGRVDYTRLKALLEPLSPRMHHAVRLMLGIDQDGHKLDAPLSAQGAAEKAGLAKPGSTNTEVSRIAGALGITKKVRDLETHSQALATERAEGDIEGAPEDGAPGTEAAVEDAAPEGEAVLDKRDESVSSNKRVDVSAPARGKIVDQPWYKAVLEQGPENLSNADLAAVVVRALAYTGPNNNAALGALMAVSKARSAADPEFNKEFNRAYQKRNGAAETSGPEGEGGRDGNVDGAGADEVGEGGTPSAPSEGAGGEGSTSDRPAPVVITRKRRTVQKSVAPAGPVEVEWQGETLRISDPQKSIALLDAKIERHRALLACLMRA